MLLNYHIGRLFLSSLCVGDLVWLVLSGARFALHSAHTVYLCVLCGSQNKQRLFPCTALTDFYNRDGMCLLRGTDWVLVLVLQAEAQLQPAKRALFKTSCTKSPTHNELRTKRPVW